jgi:hypothetical protein
LNAEDGPFDVLVRLRQFAGDGLWGDLLDCFYCLSLWIAVPFAWWLGDSWKERLLLWPALSAASIATERLISRGLREPEPESALYFENPEVDPNVLLRKEESGSEDTQRIH